MAPQYTRKTIDVFRVEVWYRGYWDLCYVAESSKDAYERLKEFRTQRPGEYRIVKRRTEPLPKDKGH